MPPHTQTPEAAPAPPPMRERWKRNLAAITAATIGAATLSFGAAPTAEAEQNRSSDPGCADYDALKAGQGRTDRQDWFNHLDARGFARFTMACLYSWDGRQFNCLNDLWGKYESGWNHYADNPRSPAYGIPQANPGRKMGQFGPDWQHNPRTQVEWGLWYVSGAGHDKFHDPCQALSYRLRYGGY